LSSFFDPPPSAQTNRANDRPCPTCDGHRLVLVEVVHADAGFDGTEQEVYRRCPSCNPAPVTERQPVDGRWQTYDR
jgi:hypothetical protein